MTSGRTPESEVTEALSRLGATVCAAIEPIFGQLQQIRAAVESLLPSGSSAQRIRTRDLAGLDEVIKQALRRPRSLLHGAGFVTDTDVLADAPLGIRWWVVGATGQLSVGQHVIDPTRPDHYEYTDMDWFTRPKGGELRCLYGPYVDYGGTNEYSITSSVPVTVAGRFLGVAAGDLGLEQLEQALGAALRAGPHGAMVVNAERRVILSSDPRHVTGSFLPGVGPWAEQPCPDLPWTICVAGQP